MRILSTSAEERSPHVQTISDGLRDIQEWMSLAKRQREMSANYSHDPLCATDAALYASQAICARLAKARRGMEELEKRFKKSLELLERGRKAFMRTGWEEGEADGEAWEAITEFLREHEIESGALWRATQKAIRDAK
jgi:hypothetical protein